MGVLLAIHAFIFIPVFIDLQVKREAESQASIGNQLADRINANLVHAITEIESVAAFPEIRSMKKALLDAELEKVNNITQFFNYYLVVDPKGIFVSYPTRENLVGQAVLNTNFEWIERVLREKKTVFVDVSVSRLNTIVSGFATPIRNGKGDIAGILRGVISLSDRNLLLDYVKMVHIGKRGFAFLVTADGKLLAHPGIPLSASTFNALNVKDYPPVRKIRTGEKGTLVFPWNRERWYAANAPVDVSGWSVIVEQPESEMLAPVYRYILMVIGFFVAVIVVSVAMIVIIFRFTFSPLSNLVKSMREGKIDISVPYAENEIGKLANEINKLYADLYASRESLDREREKYRILVEYQRDLIVKIDLAGNFLFLSPSFCKVVGRSESELIGQPCFLFVCDDERKSLREAVKKVSVLLSSVTHITRGWTIDGIRWFEWVVSPVYDKAGNVESIVGSGRDITRRKEAEDALKESEEKFKNLAEQSPNMIFINKAGSVVYMNRMSEVLLGYSREEVCSPSFDFYRIISPECHSLVRDKIASHFRGEEVPAYEYGILSKSGRRYDVINTTQLIKYDGEPAILGIVTDITDRKFTETALRESEKQYRLLVENANDGIVITEDDRLIFANNKFSEMVGYPVNELKLIPFGELVNPDDEEKVRNRQVKRLRGEEVLSSYTCRMIAKSGKTLWVEINSVVISWSGKPALLSFVRDITVQRSLETELIQSEKMKSIGALAGGIAHDFNNKLQLLSANLYLLLMKKKPGDEDYDELFQMKDTTEKTGTLVMQLLSISKRLKSELLPIDLNKMVKNLLAMLEKTFPRNITIRFVPGPGLDTINADTGQLEQVIINLAFNSKDAMPHGGGIVVSTENVVVSTEFCDAHLGVRPGKHVRLAFTDTGLGMDEETLGKIFEPTFTTKSESKGFGLGLAMVYNILKNHNSAIFCKSVVGAGTTFEIYFPVADRKSSADRESTLRFPVESDIPSGCESILIVDDEENILRLASRIIPGYGYRVITASNGKEAVEIYEKRRAEIDLVLVDIIMPGMNGVECLEKIISINSGAKVIIMSGESLDDSLQNRIGSKAKDILYKPFDFTELVRKIRSVCDSK
jgi:PAS domain S-box-containing protein